jgi:hypothetical protein
MVEEGNKANARGRARPRPIMMASTYGYEVIITD